ncbi:hypothetical protein HDU84_003869 [Entophlyctis sp. JEL0112]|nr:hypothetical protein HDU84_003869 [Entophlyctis sp. JEL0112]
MSRPPASGPSAVPLPPATASRDHTNAGGNPLQATKTKLIQLHDSLSSFLDLPAESAWPEVLAHFNALIAKYESTLASLSAASGAGTPLRQLVAVPTHLPANDPDYVPRELLRTRLDQDVVDAETRVAAAYRARTPAAAAAAVATGAADIAAQRAELKACIAQVDAHDAVVAHAVGVLDETGDDVLRDLRGTRGTGGGASAENDDNVLLEEKLDLMTRWISVGKTH